MNGPNHVFLLHTMTPRSIVIGERTTVQPFDLLYSFITHKHFFHNTVGNLMSRTMKALPGPCVRAARARCFLRANLGKHCPILFALVVLFIKASRCTSLPPIDDVPCSIKGFEAYCAEFHKDYSANSQEQARRFEAWVKSCLFLEQYKVDHPDASFHMGFNPLSDRLPEEHDAIFGLKVIPRRREAPSARSTSSLSSDNLDSHRGLQGFHKHNRSEEEHSKEQGGEKSEYFVPSELAKDLSPRALPPAVDWRTANLNPEGVVAVTPVKNQGACGACWAFTTTAAVEGAVAVTTGVLNELSNQELIDCVTQNEGCNGGDFDYAFKFVVRKGLASTTDYQFTQSQGKCRSGAYPLASRIAAAYETDPCSENGLLSIVSRRPVAVAIDGSCDAFIQYKGGIFTQSCGSDLNHAVTIVGYGTDERTGTDYWVSASPGPAMIDVL